jgi:hypothetical protein
MPLPSDTRQAFGIMLVNAKGSGTLSSKILYAELLIEFAHTGLESDNLKEKYARELNAASIAFTKITDAMLVPERRLYQESTITHYSNIIGCLLLPILINNKYILIDNNSFMNLTKTQPTQGDQ